MTADIGLGIMLTLLGAGVIFCMYMNFDFMFQSANPGDRKFNALVQMFGRDTVRVMFAALGALLIVLGILAMTGTVKLIKPKDQRQGNAMGSVIKSDRYDTRSLEIAG